LSPTMTVRSCWRVEGQPSPRIARDTRAPPSPPPDGRRAPAAPGKGSAYDESVRETGASGTHDRKILRLQPPSSSASAWPCALSMAADCARSSTRGSRLLDPRLRGSRRRGLVARGLVDLRLPRPEIGVTSRGAAPALRLVTPSRRLAPPAARDRRHFSGGCASPPTCDAIEAPRASRGPRSASLDLAVRAGRSPPSGVAGHRVGRLLRELDNAASPPRLALSPLGRKARLGVGVEAAVGLGAGPWSLPGGRGGAPRGSSPDAGMASR